MGFSLTQFIRELATPRLSEVCFSPDNGRSHSLHRHACFVPILLQKSAAADVPSAISLRAAGFDPPTLTPSTQL